MLRGCVDRRCHPVSSHVRFCARPEMTGQIKVEDWWSAQPMTYGSVHGTTDYADGATQLGSREFFEQADRRFYSWNTPLHDHRPFGRLFPYDTYRGKKVLEV